MLYENDDYVTVTGDSGKKSEFPKQNQACNFPANCSDAPPLRYWRIMEANTINPLNSKIQIFNSQLLPLFISYRSSGEKLIKYQSNSSMIMSMILMTTLFYKALILQGEIWCWSLLGLKGLVSLYSGTSI